MDEPAAGEDPDTCRAAAEIDHRGAQLRLVVDERREARGVRRRHHRLDPQMAAFDDQHQIAGGRRITGGEMKIEAKFVADHALRIAHVLGRVEPEGGRKRMQDCPPGLGIHRGGSFEHVVDVVFGDGLAAQLRIRAVAARSEPPAGHVDDDAADLDAGHALGRVDGQAHGMLRRMKIDHRAALDAVRALMADAEHLAAVGSPAQRLGRLHRRQARDQAHDLGSADVEHRENGALARRDLTHARSERFQAHGWAPFLAAWASAQAVAASSVNRTNTLPGTRKSSAIASFSRIRDWC